MGYIGFHNMNQLKIELVPFFNGSTIAKDEVNTKVPFQMFYSDFRFLRAK